MRPARLSDDKFTILLVAYFFGLDLEMPATRSASFRALTRMKASARDSALDAGAMVLLIGEWADKEYRS